MLMLMLLKMLEDLHTHYKCTSTTVHDYTDHKEHPIPYRHSCTCRLGISLVQYILQDSYRATGLHHTSEDRKLLYALHHMKNSVALSKTKVQNGLPFGTFILADISRRAKHNEHSARQTSS